MKGVKYEKPLKFKLDIQCFASKPKKRDTIWLESDEWSRVKSELNTHLNHKKLKKGEIVHKPIGNYIYTFEYWGFNSYRFLKKKRILGTIHDGFRWDDDE